MMRLGAAMTDFSITIDIQAPPDRVWAVLSDMERWHEWTPSVTEIRLLDPAPLAIGSRVRIVQPKLRPAVWQVAEIDPAARTFAWVTRAPGVQVVGRHGVEAKGTGSKATLALHFSGFLAPLITRLYRGLNERYLAMKANGLKQRSEV
jgi:carbon monoxide dehydrogenase subunit G